MPSEFLKVKNVISAQNMANSQGRRDRGGKGVFTPSPNNMTYSFLLKWLQIYLKIYNGVLVYKWYNKLVKRKVWV